MRPKSIVQFEWVYLASIAIGILSSYLTVDEASGMMRNSGVPVTGTMLIVGQWVLSAIFVGIALLASRRASVVARWVIVVLSALSVVAFPFSLPALPRMGPVAILAVSQFVLSVVVIYLLYRPDAKAWFADGRG